MVKRCESVLVIRGVSVPVIRGVRVSSSDQRYESLLQ